MKVIKFIAALALVVTQGFITKNSIDNKEDETQVRLNFLSLGLGIGGLIHILLD